MSWEDGIVEGAQARLEELEGERAVAQTALDRVDAEVKRVRNVLKALDALPDEPKRRPRGSGPKKHPGYVSRDAMQVIARIIDSIPEDAFGIPTILKHSESPKEGTVRRALTELVQSNIIRRGGLMRNSTATAHHVVNHEALAKLAEYENVSA